MKDFLDIPQQSIYNKQYINKDKTKMNSSVKIIKATGIIHIIHGIISAIATFFIISYFSAANYPGIFAVVLLLGGISFLYIYIGYALNSLQGPGKVKGLVITSLVFASIEIVYGLFTNQIAGIFFIIEFVMDIICLCNMDAYRKSLTRKLRKKSQR